MSRGNCVGAARPGSTFERYEPKTASQREAHVQFQRLVDGLIANEAAILASEHPFPAARLIFLWGAPGTGKTHLVEALIHRVRQRAPKLLLANKLYLARKDFTLEHVASVSTYEGAPVVIVDDIWREHGGIDRLTSVDVRCFSDFILSIYERRTLVLVSSNFPIMAGILPLVKKYDPSGRAASRLSELLAGSGEMHLEGPDERQLIAERAGPGDAFTISTVDTGRA
jgi:DNA replication protein DnaC